VSVRLDDRGEIDTGGSKVGAFIGDHVKTSIGTLLNTGTYVGAFAMLVASGGLLPKFIPSFCSYLRGRVTTRFGRDDFYATAATAMARRGKNWTDAQRSMWDAVYVQTDTQRQSAAR